jgi:hypothetical protein
MQIVKKKQLVITFFYLRSSDIVTSYWRNTGKVVAFWSSKLGVTLEM